ncbi:MAG: M14 family metallopeptidase [Pyrinomonadaceae bacterium]|nr:M14 family metallopeptidase [Pyrinomonadaceae bacterium]MCX7639164.1 M14 family metallopeptidase [Pyrinomonadaceae bacterium]MDW8303615.1 M14 family metallopeptidase [Acidobacteriota bacterium]
MKVKVVLFVILAFSIYSQSQPLDLKTYAEKTDYRRTPSYSQTIEFAQKLDKTSRLIKYESFGKSAQKRDLPLLIAASDEDFSPEKARKNQKLVVLILACIHAGESDGKDAGLALFRDIATGKEAELLKSIVILFIPIYNVDGHENFSPYNRINQIGPEEMGFRATSTNLNLNRDFMKADAPETKAFLALWNKWKPDFFIDSHVTDGADHRYDMTYEFPRSYEVSSHIRDWMIENFEKKVIPKIEKEGYLVTRYFELVGREIKDGIATFIATPRFSTGYAALRNRPALLLESHSLKPYKTRVLVTYTMIKKVLEELEESKNSLKEAIYKAEIETINRGEVFNPNYRFPLQLQVTKQAEPFLFKGYEYLIEDSQVSGAKKIVYTKKPSDFVVPKYDKAEITVSVDLPLFYIVPVQWEEVISILQIHGIQFYRTKKPLTLEVETYRLTEPKWATRPFEGRITLTCNATKVKEKLFFPANSALIPLEQENANVAVNLLEPLSADSFVSWGFFNAIFEQKEFYSDHVMEKIAEEMLKGDEKLKKEFEEKLKDANFKQNPRARLNFFYERSPYYDKKIGLYPIGRITELKSEIKEAIR